MAADRTVGAPLAPVAKCVALPAEKLQARTRHFRLLKQRDLYPTFVGFIEAALGAEVPPAEALEDIEVSLAALTQAQAESSARAGIAAAHDDEGDLDDDEREAIARESSLRTADTIARFLRGEY